MWTVLIRQYKARVGHSFDSQIRNKNRCSIKCGKLRTLCNICASISDLHELHHSKAFPFKLYHKRRKALHSGDIHEFKLFKFCIPYPRHFWARLLLFWGMFFQGFLFKSAQYSRARSNAIFFLDLLKKPKILFFFNMYA